MRILLTNDDGIYAPGLRATPPKERHMSPSLLDHFLAVLLIVLLPFEGRMEMRSLISSVTRTPCSSPWSARCSSSTL